MIYQTQSGPCEGRFIETNRHKQEIMLRKFNIQQI
jgi:hypothetical protein